MKLITDKVMLSELEQMSEKMYGHLVKVVVDVNQEIMVVDASMHADEEKFLLEGGSKQSNVWGINLYPEMYGSEDFIEFDSMINIRPNQGNRSRGVEDEAIRKKIIDIVTRLVTT